jgi:hypothetical protein
MKKSITIINILLVMAHIAVAQDSMLTNFRHSLLVAKDDTSRVWAMINLSDYYKGRKPDSALIYGYKALQLFVRPGSCRPLYTVTLKDIEADPAH